MNESYAEWAIRKKADPDWPKCPDCREPLSGYDRAQADNRGGRCSYCNDSLHASPPPDGAFSFDLGLWDDIPTEEELFA